jgi:hypothetical protein
MCQTLLADDLWSLIENYLPTHCRSPKGGRLCINDRSALTRILFVLRQLRVYDQIELAEPSHLAQHTCQDLIMFLPQPFPKPAISDTALSAPPRPPVAAPWQPCRHVC